MSGSREFGTEMRFKKNLITEMAATLAFSTIQNNDKIGVIFFSDKVEQFIPPKKGKKHVLHIIRELLMFHPTNRGTDIGEALRYMTGAIKKRCTAFLISDFLTDKDFELPLRIAGHKHDIAALRIADSRESELPDAGLMLLQDAETRRQIWVDTSSAEVRAAYAANARKRHDELDAAFRRCAVDNVEVMTGDDYVKSLLSLFKKRG